MRTRLYGQLARTEALALDDEIEALGQTYQDIAVAGACSPEQRELFLDAGPAKPHPWTAPARIVDGRLDYSEPGGSRDLFD